MFTADKDKALLTTTTGALPRPSWYTENLLQIARPEEIAELIRRALKYIEPERLMPTSDCGLGASVDEPHARLRQNGRAHARRQHRAQGAGPPESYIPATDPHLSMAPLAP